MKIHTSFKKAFPVSAVWFGALVGPSMISGAFAKCLFCSLWKIWPYSSIYFHGNGFHNHVFRNVRRMSF